MALFGFMKKPTPPPAHTPEPPPHTPAPAPESATPPEPSPEAAAAAVVAFKRSAAPQPTAMPTMPAPPSPIETPYVKPKLKAAAPSIKPTPTPPESETSRTLFNRLFNALFDAAFIVDYNGYILQANTRTTKIFAYDPDDLWQVEIKSLIMGLSTAVLQQAKPTLQAGRHTVITAHAVPKQGDAILAEVAIGEIIFNKSPHLLITVRAKQHASATNG